MNHLASKMVLALFPPNSPFFRLTLDEEVEQGLKANGVEPKEVLADLAKIERRIVNELETSSFRPILSLCIKHLLITGNGLLDVAKDGIRFVPLHSYVLDRDPMGNILEIIIRDRIAPVALPPEVRQLIRDEKSRNGDTPVDVYTVIERNNGKFTYYQELDGQEVPNSRGHYDAASPRYIALRWTVVADEDYGRGMVDEYIGDFSALDDLSRDLLAASAAAAKIIFLRSPSAMLSAKDLEDALSGDVLTGREGDVTVLQLEKYNDFRITLERIVHIRDELSKAFLLNSSVQRNGERVTAEEIRYMAQELEDSLGGVYSLLSSELQSPLIRRFMHNLKMARRIPNLPKDDVRLTITTGLDALGRGHDLNKLVSYLKFMAEIVGPETLQGRLNFEEVNARASVGFGIETEGLWKTEEQVQQELNNNSIRNMTEASVPDMLTNAMKGTPQ